MADPTEHVPSPTTSGVDPSSGGSPPDPQKKKKKDKVRSAWISFIGRIVAQVIGAVATIVLGVYMVQNYGGSANRDPAPPAATEPTVARTRTAGAGGVALAVLPLDNFSGDPNHAYFADGMTEALIADLARIRGLRVISRTSSMQYKGQRKALPVIARELDVDFILEGSVGRSGDRVRITAQLIDARTDEHVWTRSFDETLRDVLTLQATIATEVAREVRAYVSTAGEAPVTSREPVNPEAYDLYLRGRQAWNARTGPGISEARRYFEEAIQRDPTFALAHSGLADAYLLNAPFETMKRAKAAAERAVALDPTLAEAYASRGTVHHRYDRDIVAAERDFVRALELNPGLANAHQWYAILLAEEGRDADALNHVRQAVSLDPMTPAMRQTMALVHYFGRRFNDAAVEARRALQLQSTLPVARDVLARALLASGSLQEAIDAAAAGPGPQSAELVAITSAAYTRAGDVQRGETLLRQLQAMRPVPVVAIARLYAATGRGQEALDLMERNKGGWNFQQVKADPVFDGVRNDPRFRALSQKAL